MRWVTTAHSRRSALNLGKIRPFDTSPTPWPARPMRWSPAVTDLGDSTWSTRSTAPMSMPSSSDDVATRQGSSPDLSSSSTTSRSSRAAAVVHEDDRGTVLLHQVEQLGIDRGPDRAAPGVLTAGNRVDVLRVRL